MRRQDDGPRPAHIKWLLDSDPAIRWQVMRDFTGEAPEVIAAERSRVATEGWGAQLLARQSPAGDWGGGPKWDLITLYSLVVLKDLGLDPASKEARRMIDRVDQAIEVVRERRHQNGRWPLNLLHPERIPLEMETGVARASRWNTLRALRVLRWYAMNCTWAST